MAHDKKHKVSKPAGTPATGAVTPANGPDAPTPADDARAASTGGRGPANGPAGDAPDRVERIRMMIESTEAELKSLREAAAEALAASDDDALIEATGLIAASQSELHRLREEHTVERFLPDLRSIIEASIASGALQLPDTAGRTQVALVIEGGQLVDLRRVTIGAAKLTLPTGSAAPRRATSRGRDARACPPGWTRTLTVLGHTMSVRFVDAESNSVAVSTDGGPWNVYGSPSTAIQRESGSAAVNGWDKLGLTRPFDPEEAARAGWSPPA